MIMSINRYIINHEMKLMEMGGREEILLERINLIIQGILPESDSHKPDQSISEEGLSYIDDGSSSFC
jgi:hypothetical protein